MTAPADAEDQASAGSLMGRGEVRARPLARAFFASDFHLHASDPAGIERACRFLDHVADDDADALFLLGDIFKAWLGPCSLHDESMAPFFARLARLTAAGVRVVIVHGNHDFLMGPELERALGVEVVQDQLDVSLAGQRARLLHGDVFCTRDVDYHRLHRVLRSRPSRWVFGRLPRVALEALAQRLVHTASRTTRAKSQQTMAIVDDDVRRVLTCGVDVVVCGHVHRARDERLTWGDGSGRLVVLGDFERGGSHARFDAGRLELVVHDRAFAGARPPVVAIDGPAGSGKSTVARRLAQRLGYVRLDSGALYRAVTWCALRDGMDPEDPDLGPLARSLELSVGRDGRVLLAGQVMDDAVLRSPEVSAAVSAVSAVPGVRQALLPVQREAVWGAEGLVAEGRDMASVVFPEADHQFYLEARIEVRAARRLAQNRGEGSDLEAVARALEERDTRDSGRAVAPLALAEGALVVDTSDLTTDQVVDQLVAIVRGAEQGKIRTG